MIKVSFVFYGFKGSGILFFNYEIEKVKAKDSYFSVQNEIIWSSRGEKFYAECVKHLFFTFHEVNIEFNLILYRSDFKWHPLEAQHHSFLEKDCPFCGRSAYGTVCEGLNKTKKELFHALKKSEIYRFQALYDFPFKKEN